jgi:hypothetical protein
MPTWSELDRLGTSHDGLSPEQLDLTARRAVPQPAGTFTQPVKRTAEPLPQHLFARLVHVGSESQALRNGRVHTISCSAGTWLKARSATVARGC